MADEFVPGDATTVRARLDVSGKIVLLTVSRLDARQRHKGHDRIIPMLTRLRAGGHDVLYLIAGDGDDRGRLERLANEHGVAEHVRFLGHVPRAHLPDLYRAADLFVMPSTGEGFGITFIEAMACGTPALGLAVGGAPDALCHGELGIAATEADLPDALVRALDVPSPDPQRLAAATRARFGFPAYQARFARAMRLFK